MKDLLEWLKPGARVKRYIFTLIISVLLLIFCGISLGRTSDLTPTMLIAYVLLITLSIFGIIFSFILAQRNILLVSLKNISKRNKNVRIRQLLYGDPRLKKGPRVVVIGGGSGLPNLLKGLKEYTSNITAVVNVSEDDETLSSTVKGGDYLSSGDIRKCIAALSTSESEINKLLTYKSDDENLSVGSEIIKGLVKTNGSFAKGIAKISDLFKMQGKGRCFWIPGRFFGRKREPAFRQNMPCKPHYMLCGKAGVCQQLHAEGNLPFRLRSGKF